jgi:putative DNA-invertase from lambdoid prophage Rac
LNVALYTRVSTDEQTQANQQPILEGWVARRGDAIVKCYTDVGSAWQNSDQKALAQLIQDSHRREFEAVLVWDLDRLTRGGISRFFNIAETLRKRGVRIISFRQQWTDTPSELQPLLFSVFAWFAEQESKKISDRTKAGMNRARAEGKHVGRPRKGS